MLKQFLILLFLAGPLKTHADTAISLVHPFLSCQLPSKTADFSEIAFALLSYDSEEAVALGVRNPIYKDEYVTGILMWNDVKFIVNREEGYGELSASLDYFTENPIVISKKIDLSIEQHQLGFGGITLMCRFFIDALDDF